MLSKPTGETSLLNGSSTLSTYRGQRDAKLTANIQGLLAVPFVLHSQPTALFDGGDSTAVHMANSTRSRYADIMGDVESLINDHIACVQKGAGERSKLKLLVPSIGSFFTPIYLRDAFLWQDARRYISSRRFVAPSFNDIRLVLNSAQVMSLVRLGPLQLVTFDGDLTLYDDGQSLKHDNPVISRILRLMGQGIKIGIVTAAGYTEAEKYYGRLYGLLDSIKASDLSADLKRNLVVMGGESNFLFRFNDSAPHALLPVAKEEWLLEEMKLWTEEGIKQLLDVAEGALRECIDTMHLDAVLIRKERAVGIIPAEGSKLAREQLEETVLVAQRTLLSPATTTIPFCAFNGGNDVFVDVGDKSWGVLACQSFFGGIGGGSTLHVGDQFLSAGANDFKARLACTTAWIASPLETVQLLDEMAELQTARQHKSSETMTS